ncbi:MAG: hypothetical protein JWO31_139 [Phycisphaerales bacterium]|nr:hypothetical protein [Phycisphaerales bacterium]
MTNESERLLAAALKSVGLRGSFDPADVGAKAGLNRGQAEAAARSLSNAGVLVLGFDMAAHFSPDYRKAHTPKEPKLSKKKSDEKKGEGKKDSSKKSDPEKVAMKKAKKKAKA